MNLFAENEEKNQETPDWLSELIDRLLQVLTKLLIKFGLKIIF